jgi:PadR family transcriptional regulator PadR
VEALQVAPDSYDLRTFHADGSEQVEAFTDAGELAARQRALQDVLFTDGWTGPYGLVVSKACAHIDTLRDLSYIVSQMPRAQTLGQFEQLVLTAVLTLRADAYGVSIHAKVTELAEPKAVSLGAIYVTLDRLEDKGLIASWLSDPTPERGGRAKRCYKLEAAGERALQESAATIRRMHEVLTEAWGHGRWKPARAR